MLVSDLSTASHAFKTSLEMKVLMLGYQIGPFQCFVVSYREMCALSQALLMVLG
jgi:hypothetical protein